MRLWLLLLAPQRLRAAATRQLLLKGSNPQHRRPQAGTHKHRHTRLQQGAQHHTALGQQHKGQLPGRALLSGNPSTAATQPRQPSVQRPAACSACLCTPTAVRAWGCSAMLLRLLSCAAARVRLLIGAWCHLAAHLACPTAAVQGGSRCSNTSSTNSTSRTLAPSYSLPGLLV